MRPGSRLESEDPDEGGPTGNQWSYIYDSAAFVQDVIKVTDKFSITPGFRYDYIDATDSTPPVIEDGYYAVLHLLSAVDPDLHSARPVEPAHGRWTERRHDPSDLQGYNVSGTKDDASYFLSLAYKLTDTPVALRHLRPRGCHPRHLELRRAQRERRRAPTYAAAAAGIAVRRSTLYEVGVQAEPPPQHALLQRGAASSRPSSAPRSAARPT